ncbi:hypothetical protein LMG33818_000909 [Halomonadaceae bacterium LMG 33818]|uniref:hypothetical protein n=1 Tax=Cernens ardua TaxID=3402176 RepID=UPI003EDC8CCE
MSKRQPIYQRCTVLFDENGNKRMCWVAASVTDAQEMKARGYRVGDVARTEMTKPRNPEFHRLAHAIGGLCVQNIEDFEGKTYHEAIKKLQFDSGIKCVVTITDIPNVGSLESRQPESIAFDNMDQTEFFEMVTDLCSYIAKTYWPSMTGEQVEDMAQAFVQERAA